MKVGKREIERQMRENTHVFLLMAGYGKANLFRDLNKRYAKLFKKYRQMIEIEVRAKGKVEW